MKRSIFLMIIFSVIWCPAFANSNDHVGDVMDGFANAQGYKFVPGCISTLYGKLGNSPEKDNIESILG